MIHVMSEEEIQRYNEKVELWWKNLSQIYKDFLYQHMQEFERVKELVKFEEK
jgi:hypothetical protein